MKNPASNGSSRERVLTRRQMLGGVAAAGLLAGAGAGMVPLTRDEKDPDLQTAGAAGSGSAEHQWVFVADLRRCDGCDKCVKACRQMHFLREGEEWIRIEELTDGFGQTYYRPVLCQLCQNPPCVKVCPVGATFKTDDGVTLVDQDRCIGCRMCMAACPYDVRHFNWDDPPEAPRTLGGPTPEWPIPQRKGTVGKCLACVHNTRQGKLPACVERCNMRALYIGDLVTDLATNGKDVVRLSELLPANDAYRYKEELNTRPRFYYITGHGQDSD